MSKGRTLSQLISTGAVLADGQISASEIVGMVSVLKVTGTTYPGDDLAANPSGGQTITLAGSNFISTPTVYVGDTIAPSVTFVSSTQLTFTAPAKTAGTYSVYVVNPDGTTAILVNGISYSGTPTWTTAAGNLGTVDANFTIQLQATGDDPVTYGLTTGSTLPSGVTLNSTGLITGTAIGSDQTFSFSVDAIDAQRQETPRSFQVTVVLADPYFKYVTLLLQADPTITPFNSDASTNAFNLTLNGDIRSDNFTPYQGAGYYSIAMDGNGDYITTPTTADFDLTGDFTIECWVNVAASGSNCLFSVGVPRGAYSYTVYINSDNTVNWSLNNVATWNVSHSYSTTEAVPMNTWTHLAFVRSGSTFTIYFNGVSKYTTASYTQPSTASGTFYLGTYFANTNNDNSFFRGNISNFRILKGTALYTAAFTPPTAPLTAITNTKLLVAQNNRFVDNSANNAALTLVGDTKISPAQPFTNPTNISTYGSGYFSGTAGSYLETPYNAALDASTGPFTYECWLNPSTTTNKQYLGGSVTNAFFAFIGSGTVFVGRSNVAVDFTSNATVKINQWNHVVIVRNSSNNIAIFINGSREYYAATNTNNYGLASNSLRIGVGTTGSSYEYNGYISDVRIAKSALYDPTVSTITIPSAPLTAGSAGLLTTQYNGSNNNSGFKDTSQFDWPITRYGNTTQGSFSPYGTGWSNYFDGSSNLALSSAPVSATGAFTIECWVYITGTAASQCVYGQYSAGDAGRWMILWNDTANKFTFAVSGSTSYNSTNTYSANTWYHIAWVRDGSNNLSFYVNGVRDSTNAGVTTSLATVNPMIGNRGGGGTPYTGYVSNLRITNTAVYSGTTYTVSTTPLTNISGTTLLTCQSNRFVDNETTAKTFTLTGSPSVQRFSPFSPTTAYSTSVIGGSGYFDGSGDYLSVASNAANALGSGNFTIQFWFYLTGTTGVGSSGEIGFIGCGDTTSSRYVVRCQGTGTRVMSWWLNTPTNNVTGTTAIALNTWYHVALVRNGSGTNNVKLYLNGALESQGTSTYNSPADNISIGRGYPNLNGEYTNGYITDMQMVVGTAVYTSAFTPPTAPLTAITNTQLLCNFANSGILDNAIMNDLETVGNAQISTSVKKYGTGSLYFDGTGDYLTTPSLPVNIMGTGDFTIEMWVYPTTITGSFNLIALGSEAAARYVVFLVNGALTTNFYGSVSVTMGGSVSANTWTHIAICRSGTTIRGFINGTLLGTTETNSSTIGNGPLKIASDASGGSTLNGYIDDLRITKGVARYTANFTPPTLALKAR